MSLDEILEEDKIFLVDTSAKRSSQDFLYSLWETRRPTELDLNKIEGEIESVTQFNELLDNKKVLTIKQVLEELSRFTEIIGEKENHLFRRNNKISTKKEKFSELRKAAVQMTRYCRRKSLSPTLPYLERNITPFFDIIRLLDEAGRLRRGHEKSLHEANWKDKHTDEYLVAYAYSLMLSGKKCGILTADMDLVRLMETCTKVISGEEFFPENSKFREHILKNGYGIYLKNNLLERSLPDCSTSRKIYKSEVNLSETAFETKFSIEGLDRLYASVLKEEIYSLIKQLSTAS